jgi:hypothetical protein
MAAGASHFVLANALQDSFGNSVNVQPVKNHLSCSKTVGQRDPIELAPLPAGLAAAIDLVS